MLSQVKMVSDTSSILMPIPHASQRLQTPVRPVATRLVAGVLAAAESDRACLFRLELDRREPAALVRAVAERLIAALATGAPPVRLAGLHLHPKRALLRDHRLHA